MTLFFYIIFVIFFMLIMFEYVIEILFHLQFSGYELISIYRLMLYKIKNNYLYYALSIVAIILLIIINYSNTYFLCGLLLFVFLVILLFGNKYKNLKLIKYTKRMVRIIIVYVFIVILFLICLLTTISSLSCVPIFPICIILNYLFVSLTILMLYPIEKLIGYNYIRKAKKILSTKSALIKIGITGSYGKTSTKEILASILSTSYSVLATPKSYNTPFGITKTIIGSLKNSHEIFICEMGAKKVGEIKYLCNLVAVNYGVVTSVGRQHTNTFGSVQNIYRTKKELSDYLYNGACVFNINNAYVKKMYNEYNANKLGVYLCLKSNLKISKLYLKNKFLVKKSKIYFYATYYAYSKNNMIYAKNIAIDDCGSSFDIYYDKEFMFRAKTELLGIHNILNILLSVSIAKMLKISNNNIYKGISSVKSISARMEKVILDNGAIVINNGYNSNIDSIQYAMKTLNCFSQPYKVVITPGIIDSEDDYSYNVKVGEIIGRNASCVYIVKEKNKQAIMNGLKNVDFDMNNVKCFRNFADCKNEINWCGSDYVFLIENDLPDNYI